MTTNTAPRLVVFGPKGLGAGALTERLGTALGVPTLSTGVQLRLAARERSFLGRVLTLYLGRDGLVPDELVLDVLRPDIETLVDEGRGFILDGFPRTLGQAVALDVLLHAPPVAAIELTGSADFLQERRKRTAANAAAVDVSETLYERRTAPLRAMFRAGGRLVVANAEDVPWDVEAQVLDALASEHGITARGRAMADR